MRILRLIERFLRDLVRFRLTAYESVQTIKNPTPTPGMTMPIPLELHQQLLLASLQSGFEKEVWEIGATAIRDWLIRNQPDAFAMAATIGYQWKDVFLPHGTLLHTVLQGKNFHARVEGDRLLFDHAVTSPSRFVNAIGGIRRNAWKVLWILFSNTSEWQRADMLRTRNKPSELKSVAGKSWKVSRHNRPRI